MSISFYVIPLHINVEQTIFTIALTQIYKEFGPIIFQQIKQQCRSLSNQNRKMIRQVRSCQEEIFVSDEDSLPAIIFIGVTPYIAFHQLCTADSLPIVNHLASSITLKGTLLEPFLITLDKPDYLSIEKAQRDNIDKTANLFNLE
jgi:hypothetical protein